jgi:WD40 repeat protein
LSDKFELKGHTDWINDIAFSPDGKYLYSSSGSMFGKDRSLRIWSTETGECVKVLEGHTEDVDCIDVSPDGRYIVSASRDFSLKIWSTVTQQLICTIVPLKTGKEVKLFYYTPTGIFYGPEEFYGLVSITKGGKTLAPADLRSNDAKAKIIDALK